MGYVIHNLSRETLTSIVILEIFVVVNRNRENEKLENLIATNFYNGELLQPFETANNKIQ